ncbi:efflux transporter periplasmic adaptor subunit [Vibrio navarrensis]|uniref:Efflux RND transporter periplasmic adaptor subunit n=1 Tax=Vibrio navarrensis TaxID=29495 RepID=A0AAJ4I9B4_9VIBR|nr:MULTISPECIES: efflux RND transporter periplasmic adaptor subunit [Vibrio]KJR21633.1 acriflavin resistance protein [Vibrio sp. S234-5]MBE3652236.1 efflux transporter periplasmic adaptor subunit [Vibrio navarrensis]MBE3656716.1 efflux transporter periplasmic adaptor subunit [Vibrio navarrensis]MBE3662768.1 efflux transporter periplasmic adaptor subunit [Vibrio navarrensis]MBE4603074.1 efflux transporter periplasmic adaptor subunit [Vibrio navarrensis]
MRRAFVFLAVAATVSGCGRELPPIPEPESRPAKLFTVSVGNSQFERTFPAVSEAGDKAVLTFRVPGQLQTIEVTAGQRVSKGQTLATLNPDEYALLSKQAKANFTLAEVQYERFKKLRADKVVSEQDFDQAQANHKSARATLEQAEANLRYTKLVAPYDGTVSLVIAETHEYVGAKQTVMNIQSNQLLKVIFQLPDHLLGRFSSEKEPVASMKFDAFPEHEFPLRFQEIDTESDSTRGSYKVTMIMERPQDLGVLPGMAGNVRLVASSNAATQIPQNAIFMREQQQYVWRVDEQGIVQAAPIELNPKREVLSGLQDGDKIIISGVSGIEAGIKVREWIKERGL